MPAGVVRVLSVQRMDRIEALHTTGVLQGDWSLLVRGYEPAYRAMVEYMARVGVDTGGRPPVWGWLEALQMWHICMVFDAEHELVNGYGVLDASVPEHLCVRTSYNTWTDYLNARIDGTLHEDVLPPHVGWKKTPAVDDAGWPVQVSMPEIQLDWVKDIRPLPRTGWEKLAPELGA